VRVLAPLFVLALIVLFILGVVVPRRSKRVQASLDRRLEKGRQKSDRSAGVLGDWTARLLGFMRRAADKASRAGRRLRGRFSR
jgi:hypothetical protein